MKTDQEISYPEKSSYKFIIIVLYVKIFLTLFLWALPLLILPNSIFKFFGLAIIEPEYYRRLLGMAYLALVLGYIDGIIKARKDIFPNGIILMGIVSNAGASILLLSYGLIGAYWNLTSLGTGFMYFSTFATGLISIILTWEYCKYKTS